MASDPLAITRHSCSTPSIAQSCAITMVVALVAIAAAVLICHAYPTVPLADFITKHQIIFLSVAVGAGCVALALQILAVCKKDEREADALPLPAADEPIAAPAPPAKKLRAEHIKPNPNLAVQKEKDSLRTRALKRLEHAKAECTKVNWRQFALMNNTSLVRFTAYEGLQSYKSLCSHLDYLNLLDKQGAFFTCEEVTAALISTLNTAKSMLSDMPVATFGFLQNINSKLLVAKINEQLRTQGHSYFLVGYCGTKNGKEPGHAALCKIKQVHSQEPGTAPHLILYFLNLGEGVQHHPELNVATTHIKTSRCFYPSQLSLEEWERNGETFIRHLLRYASDAPPDKEPTYTMGEIYDLQSLFAPLSPSALVDLAQQMEGKTQAVGDCADKAVRNLIIDFLSTEKQLRPDQTHQVFLNLHMASLVAAYHSYRRSPTLHHQQLLIHASEEFGSILLRSKEHIEHQEYLLACEMIDVILNEAKKPIALVPSNHLPLNHAPISTRFPPHTPPEKMHCVPEGLPLPRAWESEPPPFQGKQFKHDIKKFLPLQWQEGWDKIPTEDYLASLPIPQWENSHDPWNEVPLEDIKEILTHLYKYVGDDRHYGFLTNHELYQLASENCLGRKALSLFTLYAIIDKLARRANSITKLQGFASPFSVDRVEGWFAFLNPHDEERYYQIKAYFSQNHKAANGKIIFPVGPSLNFPHYVQERSSGKKNQETYLLDYLDQFTSYFSLLLGRNDAATWQQLPEEVHILYYFVSLSHLLGNQLLTHPKKATRIRGVHYERKGDGSLAISQGRLPKLQPEMKVFLNYHQRSSNEVVCTPKEYKIPKGYSKEILSRELLDELTLLNQHPKLKIGLAIPWMQAHPQDLNKQKVQECLECCFFSPGVLKERIETLPETIPEFRAFIESYLIEYANQPKHLSAILFLIRLGVTFESHVAKIASKAICEDTFQKYEKGLKVLLTQFEGDAEESNYLNTLIHYFYLQKDKSPSEEHLLELHTYLFKYGMTTDGDWLVHTLNRILPSLRYQYLRKLRHFISLQGPRGQKSLNAICNGILENFLHKHFKKPPKDWHWTAASTCSAGEYRLEFSSGHIVHTPTGAQLWRMPESERNHYHYKHLNVDQNSIWWDYRTPEIHGGIYTHCYVALDDSYLLYLPDQWKSAYLVKKKELGTLPPLPMFSSSDFKKLYFLQLLPLSHQWETDLLGREVVVSYHLHTQKPFVEIEFGTQGISVRRLDEEGNPLPYKLANLEGLKAGHPLFSHTLQFAHADEQLCFIHEKSGEIEELYFPRLDLTFKKTERGLEANDSGYYFIPMPIKALQSHSPNAIVLRHSSGKLKVILPAPQRATLVLDTKKKTDQQEDCSYFATNKIRSQYKVYPLSSTHDPFPFDTLSAQLFFVYFFKAHGDYERAYAELKKVRNITFDTKAFDVLCQFLHLDDHSPFSLAFNLRLALFVSDHFHLFQEGQKKEARKLLKWSIHWYESYLRAAGDDRFSAISCEWRLTEEEESRILSTLIREETELPKILRVRDELIHTIARTATIDFTPQEVPLSPFTSVLPPSKLKELVHFGHFLFRKDPDAKSEERRIQYPNRLSHDYLKRYFSELYQQAKSALPGCTDPFDYILLALFKTKENHEYASLLFYVRHFPEHFADLSFSWWDNQETSIATFKNIVLRTSILEFLPKFKKFEQETLKKKVSFKYEKSTTLSLPPKMITSSAPLPEVDALGIDPKPFEDLFGTLFHPVEGTSYAGLHLFDDSLFSEAQPLEKELIHNYQTAYHTLAQEKNTSYQLKVDQLDKVAVKLGKRKDDYLSALEASEKKILEYVNDPYNSFHADFTLDDQAELHLALNAHQTYLITPEMIMQRAILKNSTLLFAEHRPMLALKHIQTIVEEVHHYYHLKVLSILCDDALGHIKTLKETPNSPLIEKELREALGYTFLYTPEHYPEIAYMKIKTGKMPRPEQVLIYQWVCEGLEKRENRLFQLPAGGGKTSYLIPLMILRCKRLRLLGSVVTTQAMYSTEKENLSRTLSLLEEELDTLEVGMQSHFSLKMLKIIYHNLKKCLAIGNPLLVVPQTFYALRLAYFTAVVEDEESPKTLLLQKILSFMQKNVLLLGDESHRNLDPMTQAVFGIGNFVHLSQQERAHLFALMKPLLGIPQKGLEAGTATIQALLKGKQEKKDVQKIKEIVAASFSDDPSVITFLTNKKAAEPPYLASWPGERRYLALMTRYFLNSLLPKILKMRTDFDHVLSTEQGEIDTPAYHKTPSHAQFRDPYLTSVLSIKGTWQRGLNRDQLCALIERLKKQDQDEQTLASLRGETPSQKRFKGWIGSHLPNLTLQSVDLNNEGQTRELFSCLKKHPEVMEYYLTLMVLSHVGYSAEQFTSTPAHLMDMGNCSVIFSATPLRKNAYPRALKSVKYDPLFETRVIAQASKEKNQNFIFPTGVEDFFKQIDQNRNDSVRYMIDGDGFLCNEMNHEVAKRWLQASNLEGVIYFKEGTKGGDESLCLLLRNTTLIELKGTDNLQGQLAYHNINWDTQAIGVFFDAPHAESANFPAIPHSLAYILCGGSLTLSHLIQTIMRNRGFLDDAIDQRLIWVVPEALKKGAKGPFSTRILFAWFLQNEVKAIKNGLLMAAFQEIAFKIENIAFATEGTQSAAITTHANGFRDNVKPNQTWESNEKLENTDVLLWNYAKGLYHRFGFTVPFEEQAQLKNDIEQIISEIQVQITHVLVDFHNRAATEMHQKCIVQEQMHKLQYQNNRPLLKAESIRPHKKITDGDYTKALNPQNEVRNVFKTPHLTPNFYLEWNQLHTARTMTTSLKEKFLKPINFLMIVMQGAHVYAEAISHEVLIHHLEDLKNPPKGLKSPHQVLILRADGAVYQEGTGSLAPSKEQKEQVLRSTWLQDILIDVALLKGRILNHARFFERIQKWPQFLEFWNGILEALPYPQEHSLDALRSYLPEEMKPEEMRKDSSNLTFLKA